MRDDTREDVCEGACVWGKEQLCTSAGVRCGRIRSGVGGVAGE